MQEPTTRVYLCAYMQTHETGKPHTHVQAYSPAPQAGFPQTAPTGQRYDFLTLASRYFFSLPPRDLVSSDLPPVCIRKERLYCPAHSWYLISLQALGANPTTSVLSVSPLGACVCVCVFMYRHAHLLVTTLQWLLSLT